MQFRMRSLLAFPGLAAVVIPLGFLRAAERAEPNPQPQRPPLQIQVDPRVELMSLVFRLAGNPEYSQGRVKSYTADVEKQFAAFREHDVVKYASDLRRRRGVSFDAVMSMAVHINNMRELKLLVPFDPWPEGLDRRWPADDVPKFLEAARRFVKESKWLEFLDRHRPLYEATASRMQTLMEKEGHLEWFQDFFGERPQATFTIAPGLLNGGSCYGARCRESSAKESLYCILGVWRTDPNGLPEFTRDMLQTIVHEFGHSYANPVIDRHLSELRTAGEELFRPLSGKMRSQAYGNGETLLRESLVRACQVRYTMRYDGQAAGERAIAEHKKRGFLWIRELSNLLGEYQANRKEYPTLDAFAPRLVAFFTDCARDFARDRAGTGDAR